MMSFLQRLNEGVLLADGAMGTMLHHSGVPLNACLDKLNLNDPGRILAVHHAFLAAGAALIETNTFGANRYKLAAHDASADLVAINVAGVALAKQAIQEGHYQAYVAASVGPLGVRLAPYGRVSVDQAGEAFREQISALTTAGADVILLETFTDLNEIAVAISSARAINPNLPIIASMTFTRDGSTIYGDSAGDVARALVATGADVIGVNCSSGPSQLAKIAQVMRAVEPDALISVMPNAGFPEQVGGRVVYPAMPEYFGEYARTLSDLGVAIIGGCCGTTPDHIAAMREGISAPRRTSAITVLPTEFPVPNEPEREPTVLAQKLAAGNFTITVEMAPPRSFNAKKVIASANMLHEAGADCVDVSDSPMARMRMSPWAVCHLVQNHLGMETILHFPTRGRNILRIQGDLLAAHALNVRNIFVVMGDPTAIGDYPDANDKNDIVPSGLISLIKHSLNTGTDKAGNSIGQPTSFFVGCALNLCPADLDKEIGLLVKKIEAGADFALTQTVYDPARVEGFLKRYETLYGALKMPILAGILPLYGAKHASFLHNEVPGVEIPEAIRERITAAGEVNPTVGIQIATEILSDLQGMVQGAYLIPPFGKYDIAAEIIERVMARV
ncbi:MAG TPA: bifunctional homocysteine S-methyltransferase/methylenetetrahydrofolate reductase [Aggregatilineales bacterium]|nr:bifunctional homocysteine S-methyltransferase/methylenetetrahydrofolate reductase [Anaerolineales bacterium]HRE48644.1 bifunctional homocysteine S-methyltransferase/methylenetetrahydrofolate reductase [Aggregatilineales bacterium]